MGSYRPCSTSRRLFTLHFQTRTTLGFDATARCMFDCATCFLPVWWWPGLGWSQRDELPTVCRRSDVQRPPLLIIPRWLGQNSKQGKLTRQLGEVQIHMRLKVSGDKTEIRQHYLPALFPYIVKPLADDGSVGLVWLGSFFERR